MKTIFGIPNKQQRAPYEWASEWKIARNSKNWPLINQMYVSRYLVLPSPSRLCYHFHSVSIPFPLLFYLNFNFFHDIHFHFHSQIKQSYTNKLTWQLKIQKKRKILAETNVSCNSLFLPRLCLRLTIWSDYNIIDRHIRLLMFACMDIFVFKVLASAQIFFVYQSKFDRWAVVFSWTI